MWRQSEKIVRQKKNKSRFIFYEVKKGVTSWTWWSWEKTDWTLPLSSFPSSSFWRSSMSSLLLSLSHESFGETEKRRSFFIDTLFWLTSGKLIMILFSSHCHCCSSRISFLSSTPFVTRSITLILILSLWGHFLLTQESIERRGMKTKETMSMLFFGLSYSDTWFVFVVSQQSLNRLTSASSANWLLNALTSVLVPVRNPCLSLAACFWWRLYD